MRLTTYRNTVATWLHSARLGMIAALVLMSAGMVGAASAAGSDFANTTFAASPSTIRPGETTTLTVQLQNSGSAAGSVDVAVPIPEQLDYAGGASGGGKLTGRAVTWSNVNVGDGGSVALSFQARADDSNTSAASVRVAAAITAPDQIFTRVALVTISLNGGSAPEHLASSSKTASSDTVAFGENVTYTITLRNTGSSSATASVVDPLPDRLDLVSGTISGGGSYNSGSRSVAWNNVSVPAGQSVALSFQATPNVRVIAPSLLTNVAQITSGGVTFSRDVTIAMTMLPVPPQPLPLLGGSFKMASKSVLAPGEQLTYTINLHNSSTADATASVSDPLPAGLSYVAGSASNGGSFSGGTVSWNDLSVPAGGDLPLTFKVTTSGTVTRPTTVFNSATITSGSLSIQRRAAVVLLPQSLPGDHTPPMVSDVRIGTSDVTSSRDVTLQISATGEPANMYVQEWWLATTPGARWTPVQNSGWVAFKSSYAWKLGDQPGTHVVGVRVADRNGNVSPLTRAGIDFISLTTPASIGEGNLAPYMVYFDAGVNVSATLKTTSGDADLYLWRPTNRGAPDATSTNDTSDDAISFTTSKAGVYLFLVYGAKASNYTLSISPGGGTTTAEAIAAGKPSVFSSEPVLSVAGFDPLDIAGSAPSPGGVFVPIVRR